MHLIIYFQHACAGDSGGPLYINQQLNDTTNEITGQTLAGILSGSGTSNCGSKNIYNYWIRVSEHLDWIKCVKKNAEENKSTRNIQRACNKSVKSFTRKYCKTKNVDGKEIKSCEQCERKGLEKEICVKENFF